MRHPFPTSRERVRMWRTRPSHASRHRRIRCSHELHASKRIGAKNDVVVYRREDVAGSRRARRHPLPCGLRRTAGALCAAKLDAWLPGLAARAASSALRRRPRGAPAWAPDASRLARSHRVAPPGLTQSRLGAGVGSGAAPRRRASRAFGLPHARTHANRQWAGARRFGGCGMAPHTPSQGSVA